MDRNEWSRRQLGSDCVGRPAADPLEYFRLGASGPRVTSQPVLTAIEDVEYSYTITTNGGSELTITAPTKPSWATFTDNGDGTATLVGTPDSGDLGAAPVVISIADGENTNTQEFTINVLAESLTADSTLWTADTTQLTADRMAA